MTDSIGKVVEVNSDLNVVKVKIISNEALPTYNINGIDEITLNIHVGSLLKTKIGFNVVILEIFKETLEQEKLNKGFSIYECKIIGRFENSKFYNNINIYPILNAGVRPLEKKEHDLIYNQLDKETALELGENARRDGLNVYVDFEKTINSHIGVFGNTGSGKSNTLASLLKLLSEFCEEKEVIHKPRFYIFDVNNEYGKDAIVKEKQKVIYCANKNTVSQQVQKNERKKVKIKYEDLNEEILLELLNATEKTQEPIVRKSLKMFKENLKKHKNDTEYFDLVYSDYKSVLEKVFDGIQIDLVKIITGLFDNLQTEKERQSNKFSDKFNPGKNFGNYEIYYNDKKIVGIDPSKAHLLKQKDETEFNKAINEAEMILKNAKERIIASKVDYFILLLIKNTSYANINHLNQMDWLVPIIYRSIKLFKDLEDYFEFTDKNDELYNINFNVFQLEECDPSKQYMILLLIANSVFNKCKLERNGEDKKPFHSLLVIDEAHNFFDSFDKKKEKPKGTFLTKLIREGRKYGLYLLVSSQRPADIPQDFLSQIHNFFIHKLINERDIEIIKKTNSYIDSKTVNQLSNLDVGECVVSGISSNRPEIAKINLEEEYRPISSNIPWWKKNE